MKILLFWLIFYFLCLPAFAISTKASKFVEQEYIKVYNYEKVHINLKKEYKIECRQKIGSVFIHFIIFGWGDMMCKYKDKDRPKKCRITYVVLTDKSGSPCWSKVNVYK